MKWQIYSSCYGSPIVVPNRTTFCDKVDPFGRTDLTAVRRARQAKILGNLHLNSEISVYCDSAIDLLPSVEVLVKEFESSGAIFGAFRHITSECTYEEAETVLKLGLDVEMTVLPQMRKYQEMGLPKNWGLFETGFCMFRKDEQFVKTWWNEVEQGSHRDQLSLMPVIFKLGVPVFSFGKNLRKSNHLVMLHQDIATRHSKKSRRISWL